MTQGLDWSYKYMHAFFDRISDKLRCNNLFHFFNFFFLQGLRPFQDAYGTKLATARMFQRHLVLRALGRRRGETRGGNGLMPTKYIVPNNYFSQLWAQDFEPFFLDSTLGSQRIPVVRARSCMSGKLGKGLSD